MEDRSKQRRLYFVHPDNGVQLSLQFLSLLLLSLNLLLQFSDQLALLSLNFLLYLVQIQRLSQVQNLIDLQDELLHQGVAFLNLGNDFPTHIPDQVFRRRLHPLVDFDEVILGQRRVLSLHLADFLEMLSKTLRENGLRLNVFSNGIK